MKLLTILLTILLYIQSIYAKRVALLVETAPGGGIHTEKDIVTMKNLLKNFQITILNAKDATYKNIKRELEKMQSLNSDDIFLFYYSGHGANVSTGGAEEMDNKDDLLIPTDIKVKNGYIYNYLLDNELNYLYSQIAAKKIVIIDACHSSTMYKGFGNTKYGKYKDLTSFKINKSFQTNTDATNLIHFAAAKETETAEGSQDGGIFTLAIKKSLEENGNISFTTLLKKTQKNIRSVALKEDRKGLFTPKLYSKGLDPSTLYTKDIFILPKRETLQEYLDSLEKSINLQIHNNKQNFKFGERVILKANVDNQKSYIYLLELLSPNRYKILESKTINNCIKVPNREYRVCQYKNLVALPPFGKSNIYIIQTNKQIFKSNEIIDANSLKNRLQHTNFKVGATSFNIYGKI